MKKLFLVCLFLSGSIAHAQLFSLPQLGATQIDPLLRNLAADLAFRPVEGVSGLTRTTGFGLGFGLSATATSASAISSITGSSALAIIPAGYINIEAAFPLGLGIEFGFLPTLSFSGTQFGTLGGDIKWHFSKFLPMLPFDAAIRVMVTSSTITSTQLLNAATINVNYGATQFGSNIMIAKTFSVFEPYLALGFINHSSTLSSSGAVSLFGASFPAGTLSVPSTGLGLAFTSGFQFKLGFFTLGAQYDNLYATSSGSAKVGFKF